MEPLSLPIQLQLVAEAEEGTLFVGRNDSCMHEPAPFSPLLWVHVQAIFQSQPQQQQFGNQRSDEVTVLRRAVLAQQGAWQVGDQGRLRSAL